MAKEVICVSACGAVYERMGRKRLLTFRDNDLFQCRC